MQPRAHKRDSNLNAITDHTTATHHIHAGRDIILLNTTHTRKKLQKTKKPKKTNKKVKPPSNFLRSHTKLCHTAHALIKTFCVRAHTRKTSRRCYTLDSIFCSLWQRFLVIHRLSFGVLTVKEHDRNWFKASAGAAAARLLPPRDMRFFSIIIVPIFSSIIAHVKKLLLNLLQIPGETVL